MMTFMRIFQSSPTGRLYLLTYLVMFPQMLFVPLAGTPGPTKSTNPGGLSTLEVFMHLNTSL